MKFLSYFKKAVLILLTAVSIAVLAAMPSVCAAGVTKGLDLACRIIIPSLFPYMVLSSFMIRSKAADAFSFLLSPLTKAAFFLPGCCAPCIILSLLGGFPVGARCVSVLYEKREISLLQAQRMMSFCVCPGPAFLITGVGTLMLGNTNAGVILYASQVISSLLLGLGSGIAGRLGKKEAAPGAAAVRRTDSRGLAESFILSVSEGAFSVIGMTAMIVIFTLAETLISSSGIYETAANALTNAGVNGGYAAFILPALLEVTGGCQAVMDNSLPLWCFSLCAGFGGICVHMQIFDILKDVPIKKSCFFLCRGLNGGLSAVVTYIICTVTRSAQPVFAAGGGVRGHFSSAGAAGSIALALLSGLFVLTFHSRR